MYIDVARINIRYKKYCKNINYEKFYIKFYKYFCLLEIICNIIVAHSFEIN